MAQPPSHSPTISVNWGNLLEQSNSQKQELKNKVEKKIDNISQASIEPIKTAVNVVTESSSSVAPMATTLVVGRICTSSPSFIGSSTEYICKMAQPYIKQATDKSVDSSIPVVAEKLKSSVNKSIDWF